MTAKEIGDKIRFTNTVGDGKRRITKATLTLDTYFVVDLTELKQLSPDQQQDAERLMREGARRTILDKLYEDQSELALEAMLDIRVSSHPADWKTFEKAESKLLTAMSHLKPVP